MKPLDWKSKDTVKISLIGYDPRLQKSDTIADYALFADYFFRHELDKTAEKRRFGLAKSTFEYISCLTNKSIKPEQIYSTNNLLASKSEFL